MPELSAIQLDRACGALLGAAAGDALGAPYEFGPPLPDSAPVTMDGGGSLRWRPGEWTDDTAMAIAIAEVAAEHLDLRAPAAQDRVVARWVEWSHGAKDVGVQTSAVLSQVGTGGAAAARAAARELHERTGRSGGNGALMRTAPVALAYLDDPVALVGGAVAISELTHHDPESGEACALWCLAIRHGVLTGALDARVGLPMLPPERAAVWAERLATAEASRPADFAQNGWVVEAFQAAWSAITVGGEQLRPSVEAAVRGGRDADTVAAIAGALVGAACGAPAVPAEWRAVLHGWPGLRADDLRELARRIVA